MTAENIDTADRGENGEIPPEKIKEYLRLHPDFLANHPDVLESLMTPSRWADDGVVDMQQFMLERLRDEITNLRQCAQELIDTSRSNMASQTRAHASVLALLKAVDFEHMVRIVNDDLPLLLDIDVVTIGFEPVDSFVDRMGVANIRRYGEGVLDTMLGFGRDVQLLTEVDDDGTVFGSAAGLVRSAAMARLRPGLSVPTGMIALGSRANVFEPGQGTELIGFLARVAERCVHRWLEQPA